MGILVAAPLWFGVLAVTAGATVRVQSYNDPAGDPTRITYDLNSGNVPAAWPAGSVYTNPIPHGGSQSFGPVLGTYILQARSPAGWRVNAIVCRGPDVVVYDVPHGRVTITHGDTHETCAFTNGKVGAPPSSAVSPSPPPSELTSGALPDEIALLGVQPGKGYVSVRLRLIRQSVVKLRLRRSERAIAKRRAVRRAGEREVKIRLSRRKRARLKARGRKRLPVELKAIVAEVGGRTEVFRYNVIVPL